MANRTKRTQEVLENFLLALNNARGNVSDACEAIGMARRTLYEWRNDDEDFRAQWDAVVDKHMDALESEIYRRAYEGTNKPVFYQGEECGTIKEFSDTLAMFILKGHRPEKYRDNSKVELGGANGGPIQLNVVYDTHK